MLYELSTVDLQLINKDISLMKALTYMYMYNNL